MGKYILETFLLVFYVGIIWLTYKPQYAFELNRIIKKEKSKRLLKMLILLLKKIERIKTKIQLIKMKQPPKF